MCPLIVVARRRSGSRQRRRHRARGRGLRRHRRRVPERHREPVQSRRRCGLRPGSLFRVPLLAGVDAGAGAAALEQYRRGAVRRMPAGAVTLSRADLTRPCCHLIVGSEGRGVGADAAERRRSTLRIPTVGGGIAERRHGGGDPAVRGAAAEDAAADEPASTPTLAGTAAPALTIRAAPAGRAHAAGAPGRFCRPGAHPRAGQAAARADRARPADVHDPVGTAGRRQNHAGEADRAHHHAAISSPSAPCSAASRRSRR